MTVVLLGENREELGGSIWLALRRGLECGLPPTVDLAYEQRLHRLLREGVSADLITTAHDISEGGLAVALTESTITGPERIGVESCQLELEIAGHEHVEEVDIAADECITHEQDGFVGRRGKRFWRPQIGPRVAAAHGASESEDADADDRPSVRVIHSSSISDPGSLDSRGRHLPIGPIDAILCCVPVAERPVNQSCNLLGAIWLRRVRSGFRWRADGLTFLVNPVASW